MSGKIILKSILVFLLTCALIYLYSLYHEWGNSIDIYTIDLGIPGPNLLMIAGTHGNEPAGRVAVESWINDHENNKNNKKHKGRIYVIPNANKSGSQLNFRYMTHNLVNPDLNRNYTDLGKDQVSHQIIQLIKNNNIDFIIDFHEGWGFHKKNPRSIGSTLSPTTPLSTDLANEIVDHLNENIEDEHKHFVVNMGMDKPCTLRDYAKRNNINYILVETTGQNNIQPLDVRVDQTQKIIDYILKKI
jgi:predicted deacylase